MINIQHLTVLCVVVASAACLRQSEMGNNDWSIQNIGRISQLNFAPYSAQASDNKSVRQFKNLFYFSDLGLFGHLNTKTGEIQARESLAHGERVIETDDKQMVILTNHGQILRYNKFTMLKSVDNRMANKQFKNTHSYCKANNKVYVSDDRLIHQFESSIKNTEENFQIQAPSNSVFLKLFATATADKELTQVNVVTYYTEREEVCLNELKTEGLIEKHCIQAKLGSGAYAKVFTSTGNIYFGDESDHYFMNFLSLKSEKFNSQPVSFTSFGVKFENGLTFTTKGLTDEKFVIVQSNRNDKVAYGQITPTQLHIHLGTQTQVEDKVVTIDLHGRQFGVSKVWVNFLTQTEIEVVVLFEDLQLAMFSQEAKVFKELWSREESLAYAEKVLFMKYKGYQDHLNNPYHMKMDDVHYVQLSLASKVQQIPINFIARIKSEFEDVYNFIVEKVEGLIQTFTNPQSFEELLNIKGYLKSTMSPYNEKKYGLQKYIIVITSYNTMFALDSKTSRIIWKKKYGADLKLIALIKLKQQYEKEVAIAINYKYHITYVTQIDEDGTMTDLQQFQTFCDPTVHKISVHSILIRAKDKVHRFDINKDLFGAEKQYTLYSVQQDTTKILGWKVTNEELIQTWTFEVPKSQKFVKAISSYRGQPEANLPLVNDKKVVFKNVDFSNLAVLTIEDHKKDGQENSKSAYRLHLYLINGLTGTVLFSEYQLGLNPNLPINLVYDEHNAIISYYNTLNRVYQIWSIESFQVPEESQLISKKYQPHFQKEDIIFRSKVYGTVLPVKHLFISESKQALLKRNLLIVTRQNKVISIPREMISTRRPKTNEPQTNANSPWAEYITSKYPPEEYILPVNTLAYLTYNKQLADIKSIRFSSSDLESTIFIMGYGIDLFLIRAAPDKAFDMLAEGFNYVQLIAIMVGVTLAAIFFRGKAKQAKLRKAHLD